jgi:DNA-binding response OmpR family regulator
MTILCVDDQPVVLATLALVLRHHGYTVLTAATAAEALTLSSTSDIDVALLDHSVCDRERLCLRDLFRDRQPPIKAILHTGNPVVTDCLGDVPVLVKPINPGEIAKRIGEILAGGMGDRKPAA